MTVKSIPAEYKETICKAYTDKLMTITELAEWYSTSARTIGRVLEERGLATPVPRLKGEAHQVMLLLKKHDISYSRLCTIIYNHAASLKPITKNQPVNALQPNFFNTSC